MCQHLQNPRQGFWLNLIKPRPELLTAKKPLFRTTAHLNLFQFTTKISFSEPATCAYAVNQAWDANVVCNAGMKHMTILNTLTLDRLWHTARVSH